MCVMYCIMLVFFEVHKFHEFHGRDGFVKFKAIKLTAFYSIPSPEKDDS